MRKRQERTGPATGTHRARSVHRPERGWDGLRARDSRRDHGGITEGFVEGSLRDSWKDSWQNHGGTTAGFMEGFTEGFMERFTT